MLSRTLSLSVLIGLVSAAAIAQPGPPPRPERELPPDAFRAAAYDVRIVTVADGLENPWSIAWLPNGDMLVTEKAGRIRTVRDGRLLTEPMANVPAVNASGQGGLFDIVLHPEYASNGWVYISFAKPIDDDIATTTVIRAHIRNNALVDIEEIFEANARRNSAGHYGGRMVFDDEGHLFVTSGERMAPSTGDLTQHLAQQTDNHFGAIVRLNDDGSVPNDNPFVGRDGFEPAIWTYGHRNPQGLVFDAATGRLWETEHAPQGGDEFNLIEPGKNYGWPVIGYGANYGSGTEIHSSRNAEGMEQPKAFWVPSIAPSGLMIYRGDKFPQWEGNLFAGGLSADHGRLSRITLNQDGVTVSGREPLLMQKYRIRDVREGPDGYIYLAIDHRFGQPTPIVRLEPLE